MQRKPGWHLWVPSAGALMLAGMLAGCSLFEGQPCAAVYEPSGVNFDLTAVVDPAAGGMVRLCIEDRCEDWDVAGRDTSTSFLTIKDLTSERSVKVSALVTDAAGATTFDGRGTAELKQYPPDGPVCQEDLYRATVRAAVDGSLNIVT